MALKHRWHQLLCRNGENKNAHALNDVTFQVHSNIKTSIKRVYCHTYVNYLITMSIAYRHSARAHLGALPLHWKCSVTVTYHITCTYCKFIGRYISHTELHNESESKGKAREMACIKCTITMYDEIMVREIYQSLFWLPPDLQVKHS